MRKLELISTILIDAAQGDRFPLYGLIDYMVNDCGVSLSRLKDIALRLHLPIDSIDLTLIELEFLQTH